MFIARFSKVVSRPCDTTYLSQTFEDNSKRLSNISVTKKGVGSLLQKFKENKGTGPGKFLKLYALELHKVFTILFKNSLDLGTISDEWKVVYVCPIFKKGDKTKAVNYYLRVTLL